MDNPETVQLLVAALGAFAAAGVVFALIFPFFSGDRDKEKRIQGVKENRSAKLATRSAAEVSASRRKQVAESLKEIEARQKKSQRVSLRVRLQQAGLTIEPKQFWIYSAACGLACAIAVYVGAAPSPEMRRTIMFASFAAGFVGLFGLPRWIVSFLIKRRRAKFLAELANAIDVVVRGVKSGLPLNECLQVIARESPEPIASEFREVVEQQRVGVTLAEALDRLAVRMPMPEVKFLTIVIAIQQQAGGNLSEALGNLSSVLRDRIRIQLKVKALSAEAKASAMVLGSLPPGVMMMVSMASPDYIAPLFATKTGNFAILLGLFWMGCGVMVMRKMINFKY